VKVEDLERLLAGERVTLVDVRTRGEFEGEAGYPCDPRQGHIPGAIHVEWDELAAARPQGAEALRALIRARGGDPDRPLVLYCHSGQRSSLAVTALRSAGFEAENYVGSWHEWSRRERT
jgi:thiosulfate/3-mercaptopyruvate sulfurtransferase